MYKAEAVGLYTAAVIQSHVDTGNQRQELERRVSASGHPVNQSDWIKTWLRRFDLFRRDRLILTYASLETN